uniref:Uncharacterized protein n=1 Tax=Solanum tuberosum TaxID=4113 RepID=M1DJG8_SOLTU
MAEELSTPSATPLDTMYDLAPGQKDRLGRVMIEPNGSSWHPAKDVVRALKDCVRRLYTHVYHSWTEIPNSIRQTMFNNFKNDFHQYIAKNLDSSVQLTPELSTKISKEKVIGGTHKGRYYGLGSRNDVRRLQSGLEGIGSLHQVEALDGVQIDVMSDQIAKLTTALAESERRRVTEQQSMSETVQQIKNK